MDRLAGKRAPEALCRKRKRRHQPWEDEKSNTLRKKSGCSVNGCRNPIAGCPDFAKVGVCWYHGENQTCLQVDEVVSSPQRRNPTRVGRATFNEPELVVSAGKEKRKISGRQRGGVCISIKQGGKRIRKRCSQEGCLNQVRNGGLCRRHGAKKPICSHEGCTNQAVRGGVCVRHGAKVKQYHIKHGGKRIRKRCSQEGCLNQARNGGVCIRHGANNNHKRCSRKGCTNFVVQGGVCFRHGAKRKTCSHKGCTNHAKKGRVCCRHGAKVKTCNHEGCTKQARKKGVCWKHGAKQPPKFCSHEGCSNQVQRGGVCIGHGAKVKKRSHVGCTNIVVKGGVQ